MRSRGGLYRSRSIVQNIGLVLGLVIFTVLLVVRTPIDRGGAHAVHAAAVAALMATWWMTEALPIWLTACVPLVLFPLLGVFEGGPVANIVATILPYLDPYIFLFAGGMLIAAAMQQWGLHRRIALGIMRLVGADPQRLLLGFLTSTAFISLWISNTATATMMVPIGLAVITQLERQLGVRRLEHYGMAVMLAIAYAANVGGIGTKIGTAPNGQFAGFMSKIGVDISFVQFMEVGLPFVVLFLPIVWLVLWRIARRDPVRADVGRQVIENELAALGPRKREETIVLATFVVAATLWIMGTPLTDVLRPHVSLFKLGTSHIEAAVGMLAALTLVMTRRNGRAILALESFRLVPWSTLVLLGGSFAMAAGIQSSGLGARMADGLAGVRELPPFVALLLASVTTVGISAVASNTATINVMLNVLHGAVAPSAINTTLFTSTIAASCDFALPAGTPPNAIVFGSGYVTIPAMVRAGVLLDVMAAILAAALCWALVPLVMG